MEMEKIKVAVLCDENKLVEAKKVARILLDDDLVQKISSGEIKFDKLIFNDVKNWKIR